MSLRILSIAFPFAPVGPHAVGGAEKVLGALDEALVQRGHSSLVVACAGSRTAGELFGFSAPKSESLTEPEQARVRENVQQAIRRALLTRQVDLVHMHGLDFHRYSIPAGVPVLVTLHLPIAWYPAEAWTFRPPVRYCCVSQSQRRTCPPALANAVVVENGVPLPPWEPQAEKENFALVLGRICPEKNAHAALDAGTRAGISVWLGGQVFPYPEHRRYFDQEIAPRLGAQQNGVQHRFLGPLPSAEVQRLLRRARCLLHPTLAPETSSLVAMEALAAGTPVVAYRSGALPEIVEDGVTGFLVDGMEAMAEALGRVDALPAQVCRHAAETRFDQRRMIERYLSTYESLVGDARAEVLHAH